MYSETSEVFHLNKITTNDTGNIYNISFNSQEYNFSQYSVALNSNAVINTNQRRNAIYIIQIVSILLNS